MEITAFAPPAEAHARVAYALTEVRKYLIPDSNDEIRQEQMREMEILAANGGDSVSVAAAMAAAAAAAAADPIKRAAAFRQQQQHMNPAAAAAAAQQSLQLLRGRTVPPSPAAVPAAAAAAAPAYLAAASGVPLVRGLLANTQPQKLYSNEEIMLEAAAVSQAPVDITKDAR